MNWLRQHYLLIVILLVSLFLRLYNLSSTVTFLEDEGRDLLIMHRIIDTQRPVLLGPQTSTGNMYLGPLYYYLVTPALALAQLNPLGPVVLIALTGVFTVWLLYRFGTVWFGKYVGYMAAFLYAVSPLPVSFTRNSWNPNLAPVFALLILWVLINIIEKKAYNLKNFFLLGIFSGAIIQMHYMAMLYLVGVGVTLIIYLRRSVPSLFKGLAYSLFGFVLILLPFIVFEIRNDFVNTMAITRFIRAKEEHNIRYSLPLSLWSDKVTLTSTRIFASQFGRDSLTTDPRRQPIAVAIALILVLGFISTIRQTDHSSHITKILYLVFIIPLLLTGIYQENIHLHYLGFFFPLSYLLVATSIRTTVYLHRLIFVVILTCLVYATPQLFSYLRSSGTNQVVRAQEVANYIVDSAAGEPYNMVSASGTHTTPFLYFANISANPPTTTPTTTLYLICQGQPCQDGDVNTPFIFITGPAHPTIAAYLGHPLIYSFENDREVVSNQHVSHGAWVAKINVKIDQ